MARGFAEAFKVKNVPTDQDKTERGWSCSSWVQGWRGAEVMVGHKIDGNLAVKEGKLVFTVQNSTMVIRRYKYKYSMTSPKSSPRRIQRRHLHNLLRLPRQPNPTILMHHHPRPPTRYITRHRRITRRGRYLGRRSSRSYRARRLHLLP